jgi:nucleoside-diphosphate-sugar epimerase
VPKKYIITGVAGFIGSNLAKSLLIDGYDVYGFDNFSTGNEKNLEELSEFSNFKFYNHDVSTIFEYPSGITGIFHLASPASPPKYMELSRETMLVNTVGTSLLVDHAIETKARILFASTSEIYGDPLVHPQKESYWGNVNPIGPRSIYDEAKRFGETIIFDAIRNQKVDAIIVRIFNTYGPNMDPWDGRVVSNFIRQLISGETVTIYGSGNQTRSFCFITDLVRGLRLAMDSEFSGPINLGNPNEMNLLELLEVAQDTLSLEGKISFEELPTDDPQKRKPDITLAENLLNWRPEVEVREGISITADWMNKILNANE